ncbi:uncharacterized protein SAMN04488072_102108 [Lentibacillus halodurans]|uniref:DUF418 domain-containing protein n=1 Tax=Lentibacillus halodurans TaxID=237679 RepID=A0A1I0W293_9BACI|nr:DUF418 domain-containing protein [Lentibacillus halodurans]SFA82056.1 uncharacterized protein SAMN04488072_102108 [Lentibacillus halodurans]
MNTAVPLQKYERMMWIDAARGFAILGIFVVNIGAFSAPYFLYGGEEDAWNSAIDQFTQVLIDVFFQASFYTLFSILFGFGLQILKERLVEKSIDVSSFLLRRLVILIGFGLVHAFLIWHGDILLSYGIIGLFFIAFVHRGDKTILIWGTCMLGVSVYLYTAMLYEAKTFLGGSNTAGIYAAKENYVSDNLPVILGQNLNDWLYSNDLFSYLLLATTLLPLFLFGMYLARKRWLHDPVKHKRKLATAWIISLIMFIGLKMGPYIYGNPVWFSYIQDNIGGTASALFYLLSITVLAQNRLGKKLLKPFSYVGRMSLSNYIVQSVICFLLFYGIGIGLYGSVRPIEAMGIVAVVYTLQIFFSKWWMARYRFGPLEWVWRSLTYKQKQPLREKG